MSPPPVSVAEDPSGTETKLVNQSKPGGSGVTPIDRRTEFGNPFVLEEDGGEYTREESVDEYIDWFEEKVFSDPEYRHKVNNLRGETLGCWCVPELCHGHVILYYLQKSVTPDDVQDLQQWRSDHAECRVMSDSSR